MAENDIAPEWRACKEFPDYEVSDDGRVRRAVWLRRGVPVGTTLRPQCGQNGYLQVNLYAGGRLKTKKIHHLVAAEFLPVAPSEKHVRCHKNGDKLDNRASNLYWGTLAENSADQEKHGTTMFGALNHKSKITENDVREIRRRRANGESGPALAREYGIAHTNIYLIAAGKSWRHVV